MKLVLTGCSGYIGSAYLQRLLADTEHQVVGVDRVVPARPSEGRFQFVQCDLSQPGKTLSAPVFHGSDLVLHLAAARGDWAISKEEYWRDNLAATEGLLAAPWAPQVKYWVFASSVSVYGPAEHPLAEDAPCQPIGPYGESKLASERLVEHFVRAQGRQGRAIRPSAVFSPGHPTNTNVYKLIESMRRFPLPLIGGGLNRKTLTYLPNLMDLLDWCGLRMAQPSDGPWQAYNYVEEPVQTVFELIATLRAAGIRPARSINVPMGMALAGAYPVFALAKLLRKDLRITPERVRKYAASTWYDAARVRQAGFVPRVSLAEALRLTAAWHLAR